jgi:dolichyl-phosphate-mannose-protein mannosyltransferase
MIPPRRTHADMGEQAYKRGLALVSLLGAVLILWGIWKQPPIADDVYSGFTAFRFMEAGQLGPTMWHHPCLRSILIYWSLHLFGAGWLGVKASSIAMGLLCVPMAGMLTRRLTGRRDAALLASFLWAVEPLAILYSRQAINDIYLAFFPLAGLLAAARWVDSERPRWLIASGVFFGLGLASKWSAAVPLALALAALLLLIWRKGGWGKAEKGFAGAFTVAALGLIPLVVYGATFLPWFARGYGLGDFIRLQGSMAHEMATHQGYLPFMFGDREPWKWFILPVSYENFAFDGEFDMANPPPLKELPEKMTSLVAQGDPLVWLLVLPSAAYLLWAGVRRRETGPVFLGSLFWAAYLPLAAATRPVWVNTAMSLLPYAIPAVAFFAADALRSLPGGRRIFRGWLALVALAAVPLYLLVTGAAGHIGWLQGWVEAYYPAHFLGR